MKIEPGHPNPAEIGAGAGTAADRITERLRQEPAPGAGGDQVELSALSYFVQNAELETPEQTDRIGRLAEAVASGSYQVDSLEVSNRIIDETLSDAALSEPALSDASNNDTSTNEALSNDAFEGTG